MLQELHSPPVENVLKKSTVLNDSLVTYTGIVLAYFRVYDITYSLIKCSRTQLFILSITCLLAMLAIFYVCQVSELFY